MSIERLLWEKDAAGLAELVHKGDVVPAELVEAAIARAELVNPDINAIAEKAYDSARALAKKMDRKAPLAGVPFAIKDLGIAWKGVPSHSGSRAPSNRYDFDSVLTERYLAAGLVPIATSTSPELGLRLMTESARFGITRNPWNTGHTSGGSSGGASALVAAGVVPVAHASDGGGSIRVPSACTGLVGLKTSRGRIPLTPLYSEGWFGMIVDHVLSRTVRDSALLLDLTHGADPLSPYWAQPPRKGFAAAATAKPKKMKLGSFRRSPLGLPVSAETNAAMDRAEALAREAGHAVEQIDLPMLDRAFMSDFAKVVASSMAGHMRAEQVRVGRSVLPQVERSTRLIARLGDVITGGELHAAVQRLQEISRMVLAATNRFDAVLMPLIAHPPLPVGAMAAKGMDETLENALDRLRLTRLLRIDQFFAQLLDKSLWFTHWPAIQNVTGQPSIALPVYQTSAGLPLGVQAVGRIGDEETLISLGAQLESIDRWDLRRAPFHIPAAAAVAKPARPKRGKG
ncbi:MAG: amidase [Rhizobiaceae bacterium]|nr:amidase [Rhizobiaceae bacterium]